MLGVYDVHIQNSTFTQDLTRVIRDVKTLS